MAVVGVGIDLTEVARVRRILEGPLGRRFARRICSDAERAVCDGRHDPAECYAARFAAKEAFVKAVGAPRGLAWHEVEVVRGKGRPSLMVTGKAASVLEELCVRSLHLSLTHDGGLAAAVVVLEN